MPDKFSCSKDSAFSCCIFLLYSAEQKMPKKTPRSCGANYVLSASSSILSSSSSRVSFEESGLLTWKVIGAFQKRGKIERTGRPLSSSSIQTTTPSQSTFDMILSTPDLNRPI